VKLAPNEVPLLIKTFSKIGCVYQSYKDVTRNDFVLEALVELLPGINTTLIEKHVLPGQHPERPNFAL
jgi:hypothetical protein